MKTILRHDRLHLLQWFCCAAVLCFASTALGYLGGFEMADGYQYGGLNNWFDVSNYNAGQYGPNAGNGPGPNPAPFNGPANLWHVTGEPGSFYGTSALRNAQIGGAPPYTGVGPFEAAYVIGNHSNGRLGTTALVLRNTTPSGTGPMTYDYTLDQYDFTGVNPATKTTGTVPMSFYYEPSPIDQGELRREPKFIMSITDSTGSVGFEWGYDMNNEVEWRAGNSGAWNMTGIIGDSTLGVYDGVQMSIDLSGDTFGIDYYDVSTSLTTTLAAAGTAMGNAMLDFTHIGWYLVDNLNAGSYAGKNFFDDFAMPVPEPSGVVMGLFGAIGLAVSGVRRLRVRR